MEVRMSERTPVSRAVLEANRAFKPAEPKATEYERMRKAFHENRERLKAERLEREATAGERRSKRSSQERSS
jgi:hypothetical protein